MSRVYVMETKMEVFLVSWYNAESEEDNTEVFRTLDYATRRVVELAKAGHFPDIHNKSVNMDGDK